MAFRSVDGFRCPANAQILSYVISQLIVLVEHHTRVLGLLSTLVCLYCLQASLHTCQLGFVFVHLWMPRSCFG